MVLTNDNKEDTQPVHPTAMARTARTDIKQIILRITEEKD